MPVPGPITLNSLTPGVASLTANYTQTNPAASDSLYLQFRKTGTDVWGTLVVEDETSRAIWGLDSGAQYDVRVRGVSNADGLGPWSNTLTTTTLTDSFGPAPVLWDEDGVMPGPIVENNNGTAGASYDLNTTFGNAGALSNQVRNGRPVWQSSGGGGLRVPVIPPTPSIPQACTIYAALVPFFVDGNFRYVLRGQDNRLQIGARQDGFILASNFNGIYGVGNPVQTDGRLYVIEAVINNSASSLRVWDDVGGVWTGSGNLNFSGDISPSRLAGGPSPNTNEYLAAQFMEVGVYPGVGTTAERTARLEELLQKWSLGAPDVIEYRTATSAYTLPQPAMDGDGQSPDQIMGALASTLQVPAMAGAGTVTLGGDVAQTLARPAMQATGGPAIAGVLSSTLALPAMGGDGSVEVPPPIDITTPSSPDFNRIFQHLLPQGQTFKL